MKTDIFKQEVRVRWRARHHPPSVDRFFTILRKQREKYKFPASSIYNADESGLSTELNKLPMVSSPTISKRVFEIVS
ncbi:hypothetical protein TNCV_4020441 [Trichonephila clavipes]|nr:hypothetical protein TNCV_4020441 [Trichonephila clavipes]